MEQKDIESLVLSAIEKRKSAKTSYQLGKWIKPGDDYSDPDYPEYYNTYGMAIELAEQNRYHAEKGVFPAKIFKKKSPNQSQEEFDYVKENYQQVTLPVGIDYINTISRAFNDGNYSIHYPVDEDKTLSDAGMGIEDYLKNGIYIYGSLENFMKFVFPALKTIDANGVIAVKLELKYSEVKKGNKIERVVKSTELNEPQPYYYDCSRVIAFKDEHYALIETTMHYDDGKEEKKSKKKSPSGGQVYTYEFYDENAIWKFEYDTAKQGFTYVEQYYKHDWNRLPVEKIKGIPRVINGEVLWQSQFSFAADLLNLVSLNHSMLQIIFNKCGYPVRVIIGRPCLFEYKDAEQNTATCASGLVYDSVLGKNIACPDCHGTGLKDRFSPLHDYMINPGDQLNPGDKTGAKPFSYEAPDTSIIAELRDYISATEQTARKILHIHTSNSNVKGTEDLTATGTAIDNKQMFSFIKPISDQMFDTWQFIADACAYMRYGSKAKLITITKPITFDFNTEFDYMFELSEAVKAGFPPFVVQAILERYLNSYFFTSEKIVKSFQLIIEVDKLMGLSLSDISIQQSKGLIPAWQFIIHSSALGLINELILEDSKFFEKKLPEQKKLLIDLAKKNADENKPASNITDIKSLILNGNKPVEVS